MRVLLVDDEAIQRKALRIELAKLNIGRRITDFKEAGNGRECLEILPDFKPHVVFMDLRMPVLGGLEAARLIAEQWDTRIIILTAYDDFKYAQEALKVGAVEYLLKPAGRDDLARVMNKICEQLDNEEYSRREKEYLVTQLAKVKPFIELEYVNDIVSGTAIDAQSHYQKLDLLELKSPLRLSLLVEIDDFGALTPDLVEPERQALKQRISELMRQEIGLIPSIVARLNAQRIIALLGLPEGTLDSPDLTRTWLMSLSERIRSRINTECGVQVSVGISRLHRDPQDLHAAYSESVQALSYKFMLGPNQIVHVDDIDLKNVALGEYPQAQEKEVLEAVRLGNSARVSGILPDFLGRVLAAAPAEPRYARIRAAELFVVLSRAAGEGGAPQTDLLEHTHSTLNSIMQSQTIAELHHWLECGVSGLSKQVTGVRNMRNQRLVAKAIDYIKENFADQVSLDDLARQVYLSPFYFSHIFKEEVGVTFIEYLTQVRIDEAKRRLAASMVAVSIIAEQVGYSDVNYFSRVFKKVVGLTPTQYRERLFALK